MLLLQLMFIIVLLVWLVRGWRRPANFPPGPRGLPLIGYIPFLLKYDPVYPHRALLKMWRMYGPVFVVYMGPKPIVTVCGYEAVKEAFLNDDLIGRPHIPGIVQGTFNKKLGVIFTDGELWREQRRFTLRHLRDFGFGTKSLENVMLDEITELADEIRTESQSHPQSVVDMKGKLNGSAINILWSIVGGERFRRDDAKFHKLLRTLEQFFRSGNFLLAMINIPAVVYRCFPWLRNITGSRSDLVEQLIMFFQETLEEHEKDWQQREARDLIDVYIREMNKQQSGSYFHREQLITTILDLFAAGTETTSNSIGFTLLYLINHPHVQHKMQRELDDVCGSGLPCLSHKNDLPYTEAVMMEVQRISSITPVVVPHCALRDTKLAGYSIPKGTMVQIHIDSVHNEKSYWGDPEVFRPERHIDSAGRLIESDHLMAFGMGKRMCLGESLARNSYFLFIATLIKRFSFAPLPGEPCPTLEPISGFTMGYAGFRTVVETRL